MEILNYREQAAAGNVVAIFDLTIPALGMIFHNWKLIRAKGGRSFIAGPSYSYEGENGEKKWAQLIEINEKRRADFNKAIMEALKPFLKDASLF
jgi:hypothetical protein